MQDLSSIIRESWQRCEQYGINPDRKLEEVLTAAELKTRFGRNEITLNILKPMLTELKYQIKGTGYDFYFSDPDGYILYQTGNEFDQARELNSIVGSNWSERSEGTNAIGTAIVTGKPISILGKDHYKKANKIIACTSSLIISPRNGKLVGILDASGYTEKYNQLFTTLVGRMAELVQNKLLLQDTIDNLAVSVKPIDSYSEAIFILDDMGNIIGYNSMAGKMFREDFTGRPFNKLFEKSDIDIESVMQEPQARERIIRCSFDRVSPMKPYMLKVLPSRGAKPYGVIFSPVTKNFGEARQRDRDVIIGRNSAVAGAKETALAAAQGDCTILLLGETGTGKEVFARFIHENSLRHGGQFVAVNCGAIPENLIASELFGYEDGAFTGARKGGVAGKFEQADKGTLFLDEISEMPLELQKYLLRILEEGSVMRLGGSRSKPIDVRIIAATNQELQAMISGGRFRRDLLYRLNTIVIDLPPLKQRGDDIMLLARYFLDMYAGKYGKNIIDFTDEASRSLMAYHWPGNVRELKNTVERAVVLAREDRIEARKLPQYIAGVSLDKSTGRDCLEVTLKRNRYNISRTARELNMARNTLYKRIRELGIDMPAS